MKSHNNMFGPYRSLSMKLKRHHELACSCQMLWMLRLKPLRRCLWQWFARLSLRLAQPDRGEQMTHFCWRNVIGKKLEYREIIFFHTIANPMGGFRLVLIFRTCCQSWSNTGGQCWSNNWSTWYMVYLEKSATRVLPCKLLQVSRGCPRQVYVKTGSSGSPNVFYVPSWRGSGHFNCFNGLPALLFETLGLRTIFLLVFLFVALCQPFSFKKMFHIEVHLYRIDFKHLTQYSDVSSEVGAESSSPQPMPCQPWRQGRAVEWDLQI